MTKIKNFLYCLNVDTVEGRTDIKGIMTSMTPEYIPGLFSFSIHFSLLDLAEGEHTITIKFINPEEETIAEIDNVKVDYKKDINSNLPEEHKGINIAAAIQNVDFKKSGLYFTKVLLDGNDMGKFEIYAKGKNERS